VAFTDDDVMVDEQWLKRIVQAFAGDESVACVTGIIAPRELDTLPQQWVEGNVTYDKGLQRRTFDMNSHCTTDPLFPYTASTFGSGANMAFRMSFLRDRGGLMKRLVLAPSPWEATTLRRSTTSSEWQAADLRAGRHRVAPTQPALLGAEASNLRVRGRPRCTPDQMPAEQPPMALVFLRHAPAVVRRGKEVIQPARAVELPLVNYLPVAPGARA
jgi:Glycosyl transferase family 21